MLSNDDLIHAAWVEMARQLKLEVGEKKKTHSEVLQNYSAIYDLVSGQYAAVKVSDERK